MSRITNKGAVSPLNLFVQNTSVSTGTGVVDPNSVTYVGQRFDLSDGREVTIVQNAATALVSGVLTQTNPVVANHQGLVVAVPVATPATVGTFAVSLTLGATVLNAAQYSQGYLVVASGTGLGQTLKIASHLPAAASAAGIVFTLEDPIQVTLDATSRVNLIPNPYQNVIISPTTATGVAAGVTLSPIAASVAPTFNASGVMLTAGTQQYGFVVTKGPIACLSDVTVAAVGLGLSPSTTTAGCVTLQTTTGAHIGRALQTGVSAQTQMVYVDL